MPSNPPQPEPIPATMRAAVLEAPGAPLRIEQLPTPRPGPGEALIKVRACGLCHSDLHVLGGHIAFPTPAVLGHEVSGQIAALGQGAERAGLEVGQAVAAAFLMPCGQCRQCDRGRDDLCPNFFNLNRLRGVLYDGASRLARADGQTVYQYSMGGLAQYAVLPATALAPLPAGLDPVAAATLGCAAFTAYGAVRRGADLRVGETCAVVAVGGVGGYICQIARALGASQIIAVDLAQDKLEAALACGATHSVNSSLRDAAQAVRDLTAGRGVDVAFEALGRPETWATALSLIGTGGRMVPIGLGAGQQAAEVPINQLVRCSQRIIGSYGALTRQDLAAVVDLAARGAIDYRTVVTRRLSLDQAGQGYQALARGEVVGRAVIDLEAPAAGPNNTTELAEGTDD
ncbi:MAG: zinc-binding dehydrogenase [Bifidobacteriaceae bacterium]|jgi:S-(hydroxymethyl)glutathione dehydrogenase/alcohol dehydrogenase|nr:zinc-binding dehydrogenase [Bifidobacteriaceae bacterium]